MLLLLFQASCFLLIIVTDVNDNPPIFESSVYTVAMEENSSLQFQVSATDADSGNNGIVRYSIVTGANGKLDSEL